MKKMTFCSSNPPFGPLMIHKFQLDQVGIVTGYPTTPNNPIIPYEFRPRLGWNHPFLTPYNILDLVKKSVIFQKISSKHLLHTTIMLRITKKIDDKKIFFSKIFHPKFSPSSTPKLMSLPRVIAEVLKGHSKCKNACNDSLLGPVIDSQTWHFKGFSLTRSVTIPLEPYFHDFYPQNDPFFGYVIITFRCDLFKKSWCYIFSFRSMWASLEDKFLPRPSPSRSIKRVK